MEKLVHASATFDSVPIHALLRVRGSLDAVPTTDKNNTDIWFSIDVFNTGKIVSLGGKPMEEIYRWQWDVK